MIRSEKSSYMMPSRPPVGMRSFLITARVLRSNIVTVESPPLVMNPRPDLGAKAMPCTRGVSGMSPTTLPVRSEEHTSELQSQFHLVCRLLLEKKKKPQQSLTALININHKDKE